LDYAGFFEQAFPVLRRSWLIRLSAARAAGSDFMSQDNPPILHRKELLLPAQHPDRARFEKLTAALEDRQAFDFMPHLIGRKQYWLQTLSMLGLRVNDHELVEVNGVNPVERQASLTVARHRTAIARSRLSVPMQLLARWGFLARSQTVLDYGCGR